MLKGLAYSVKALLLLTINFDLPLDVSGLKAFSFRGIPCGRGPKPGLWPWMPMGQNL